MRLLVIDDEEDLCELIGEIAAARGFEVKTITNPETVIAALPDFMPDVILLDLMMPGTDGVELLRLLAAHVKDAKLCLMSGSDSRVLNSARRLGSAHGLDVIAALEKPLNIPSLKSLFERLAGSSENASASDLATAIATGQFMLHYQPVIDMKTRQVKGAEALARWTHPSRGLLLPDAFLENIVNDGMMQALTNLVVETAVTQVAAWNDAGENLTLSLNVTASTLLDLSLPDRILDLCKQKAVPPERLILEVTETEAMRDVTRTMDVLLRMRLRNIGVAIDDFGTGHSSLRELQRMPFSEIKIDRSFVTDMANNRDYAVIVSSIIDLARNLDLKVIAEGIEDAHVWDMLVERGCHYGQGFFMGRPMTETEFGTWLKNWRAQAA